MSRQLGQKQILPKAEDTQNFVWEVAYEDGDQESEAQKYCGGGGSQTLNSKSMVDYHVEGAVDPLYVHWFFDRARLKVMPEGSE